MKPKFQITEEEAREMFRKVIPRECYQYIYDKSDIDLMEFMITTSKDYGYIRKSLREEAEEMYNRWDNYKIGDKPYLNEGELVQLLHGTLLEQDEKIKQLEAGE